MAINKRLLILLISIITLVGSSHADNGINSPYSRYGLGLLSDQNLGVNRQLGGLGYALSSHSYINLLNPASLAKADTITMLFEGGFSLQNVNFKEGNVQKNAKNASFDYLAMQFRAFKNVGISIGCLPYSNVGYSFATKSKDSGKETTSNYNGEGGIYQPYIGIGWAPVKNLSVGLMASYIYGDITHSIYHNFSESSITDMQRVYNIKLRSYKLDFGAQYSFNTGKKHNFTLGAIYSLGHNLNADVTETTTITSEKTETINGAYELPHTIGAGILYNYNDKWKFGVDYTYQKWGTSKFLDYDEGTDRSKISAGVEYSPGNMLSRNIFKKMQYRMGAYYAQPYTNIEGQKGCEEYGVSAGFSFPIINHINNRSMVHVSGQVVHVEPQSPGMIAETCLRLNIGITFNESWFMQLKLR